MSATPVTLTSGTFAAFILLHRQANADRAVWVNVDHIALIAEEVDGHARLRLCDAMVVDVHESATEVIAKIEDA